MNNKQKTVVDFIARGDTPDQWKMVLVEQGPWSGSVNDHLRRIQDRLYGCIDAALDGKLAAIFPESHGKNVVLQLDCYNVPRAVVEDFFDRFSAVVFTTDDYRKALECSEFVRNMKFEINFDNIH